jgi:aspartyl protease family protein
MAYSNEPSSSRWLRWLVVGLAIGYVLNHKEEFQHNIETAKSWFVGTPLDNPQTSPAAVSSANPSASPSSPHLAISPKPVHVNPPVVASKPAPLPSTTPGYVELTLSPASNGNFYTVAQINGHSVKVLVDTGASLVSIPASMQARLGLPTGKTMLVTTASDTYASNSTTIQQLTLGQIVLQNVAGELNPRSPDGQILLGMSALKNLELVEKNNTLVIRAPRSLSITNAASPPSLPPDQATEMLDIKRPVRDCMGQDKVIDEKVLECMEGK